MAYKLTQLKLREVSLVDNPANPGAHVLLFKRKEESNMTLEERIKALETSETALKAQVAALETERNEFKSKLEAETAKVKELETAKTAAEGKATEAEKARDKAIKDLDEVKKSGPEEVLKIGEKEIKKSAVGADAFEALKAQNEVIEKQRDEADLVQYINKARTEMPHLPGKPEEIGKALREISKIDKTVADVITAALKAGEAALAEATKAAGDGGKDEQTAEAQLVAKAKEIQKATSGLSYEDAYERALEQNPALYTQYEAEKRKAA
jgi:hypothetical protein